MSPDEEPLKPVDRMRIRVAAEGYHGYKALEQETNVDQESEIGSKPKMNESNNNSNENSGVHFIVITVVWYRLSRSTVIV